MKNRQQDLQPLGEIPYPSEPRHASQPWRGYHSDRHSVKDWGPSMTKQSEAESCDINLIIARHGIVPPAEPGNYGDFSAQADFLEAQNIITFANQQFMALDARVRARFHNDPAEMLAFVEDPANAPEMVKLGLATKMDPPPATVPEPPLKGALEKGPKKAVSKGAPRQDTKIDSVSTETE